jgi:hypothetical protein
MVEMNLEGTGILSSSTELGFPAIIFVALLYLIQRMLANRWNVTAEKELQLYKELLEVRRKDSPGKEDDEKALEDLKKDINKRIEKGTYRKILRDSALNEFLLTTIFVVLYVVLYIFSLVCSLIDERFLPLANRINCTMLILLILAFVINILAIIAFIKWGKDIERWLRRVSNKIRNSGTEEPPRKKRTKDANPNA